MIIVTGATGQLGHAITLQLISRFPANGVGVSVRDPKKAADLEALGVRVRQADFDNPQSLRHAFEAADQVLLISSNAGASGGDPLPQHRAAIEAAQAVGAKRLVYTSHMAASYTSAFPPMHDHASTEAMLRQSGIAWTALRNGFYGASGIAMMGEAIKTGILETALDGTFSWAAHADLAEAAAIILANQGQFDGPTPALTGSEALDFADLAAIASELRNKPVRREILSDEAMRAKILARGTPARAADVAMGLYIAARNGEFATIDPTLAQLLDRPLMSMRDLLAANVEA